MEKPSNTPSQRTQLIASVLLLSVPLLLVAGCCCATMWPSSVSVNSLRR